MQIDYKTKYQQMTTKCKKYEDTIAKLQSEIRERCQSYLLYSSRNKRGNMSQTYDLPQARSQIISTQSKRSLESSIVEPFKDTPKIREFQEKSGQKQQARETEITPSKLKSESFLIISQLNVIQEASSSPKPKLEENQDSKQMIIKSYKQRIEKIHEEKTKYAKLSQKYQAQLHQAHRKISILQKKVENLQKTDKKMKTQVAQIGHFEEKIHHIYKEISYKLNYKEVIDPVELTNFNQKLEFLLTIVSESSLALNHRASVSSLSNDPRANKQRSSDDDDDSDSQNIEQNSSSHEPQDRNPNSWNAKKDSFMSAKMIPKIKKFPISTSQDNVRMIKNQDFTGKAQTAVQCKGKKEQQEQQMKIQKVQVLFQHQIQQMKKEHALQLQSLKQIIKQQKQNSLSLQRLQQEQKKGFQSKYKRLLKELQAKENKVQTLDFQLQNTKDELSQSKIKMMENQAQLETFKNNLEHSRHLEESFNKVKEELDRSRSIIDDLEHSKLNKEINDLKSASNNKKTNLAKSNITDSSSKIIENLEEPYYVEEELYHDPNDQYVKRSFIRKKIVRRNFSATAYRVVSKSKQDVESTIRSKLKNISDKSLEKKEQMKESLKTAKQSVKTVEPQSRISEVSAQNRESDYIMDQKDVVKVLEVKTKTRKEEINTTKISSKNGEEVRVIRKKKI